MDEREFFDERSDKKPANLSCPHCHQSAEYEIQWLVRMKKKSLPPRADDRDRAKFAKAQSYMLRRDDMLMCKNVRCRKRFEITGVQSVAFLEYGVARRRPFVSVVRLNHGALGTGTDQRDGPRF